MKVAIINAVCGYSSTGKNVVYLYNFFKNEGYEVKIFYGIKYEENKNDIEDFVYFGNNVLFKLDHIVSALTGWSDSLANKQTDDLLTELKHFKPDIVLLYNIHGGYLNEFRLLEYCKLNIKWTLYFMPDEYSFTGKCCYTKDCNKYMCQKGCYSCEQQRTTPRSLIFDNSQRIFKKKEKAYNSFDNITFVSAPYIVEKGKKSWLLKDKEFFDIDSFVDIKNMYYPRDVTQVRKELKIDERKRVVMLCASLSSPYKGAVFFHEAARRCIGVDDLVFINVGFDGDINKCSSNMIAIKYIHDQNKLSELLSLADAYVCTSISDAQPNACLNALGCGTPIIGFNVSGVPFVASAEFGDFVEPFNIELLVSAIKNVKKKTKERINQCHNYAMQRFSLEASEKKLKELMDKVINRIEKKNV